MTWFKSVQVTFALAAFSVAACANINTISRTTLLEAGPSASRGKAIHLDIQQRVVIVDEFSNFCAEPSPDALAAFAAAAGLGASNPTSAAI